MIRTIATPVKTVGIGLHSGRKVTIAIKPAPINAGVCFVRVDLPDQPVVVSWWVRCCLVVGPLLSRGGSVVVSWFGLVGPSLSRGSAWWVRCCLVARGPGRAVTPERCTSAKR